MTATYVPEAKILITISKKEKTLRTKKVTMESQIFILSIYTLGDLGDSSNLIGSLPRTMTFCYIPRLHSTKQGLPLIDSWSRGLD